MVVASILSPLSASKSLNPLRTTRSERECFFFSQGSDKPLTMLRGGHLYDVHPVTLNGWQKGMINCHLVLVNIWCHSHPNGMIIEVW